MELDLMAGIFADLGSKVDTTGKQLGSKLDRLNYKPIRRTIFGSSLSVASGLSDYALVEATQRPALGRIWNLRHIGFVVSSVQNAAGSFIIGYNDVALSTSIAAAAAGSLIVPAAFVTGWRVDPAAAWIAGAGQVTITNMQSGTQTYNLPGGTTSPLIVSYPAPVPAPFGLPVISVPAMAAGPAYTINAYARNLGNGINNTAVDLYCGLPEPLSGQPVSATGTAPALSDLIESNLGPMPFYKNWNRNVIWITANEVLYSVFQQVPSANTQCIMIARVEEWPVEAVEALEI